MNIDPSKFGILFKYYYKWANIFLVNWSNSHRPLKMPYLKGLRIIIIMTFLCVAKLNISKYMQRTFKLLLFCIVELCILLYYAFLSHDINDRSIKFNFQIQLKNKINVKFIEIFITKIIN